MTNLSSVQAAPQIDKILNAHLIANFDLPGGTDKQAIHSYGPVYEYLMTDLINSAKPTTIMEVGVQHGGSMLLWHDLCPNSHIIGLDVQDIVHPSIWERMESSRYTFFLEDAYTKDAVGKVKAISGGIDFAIDDGPHSLASQCAFLEMYLPLLKKGGIAVVEDIQDRSWFDPLINCVSSSFSFETIDRCHIKNRYDDLMLIVRHD